MVTVEAYLPAILPLYPGWRSGGEPNQVFKFSGAKIGFRNHSQPMILYLKKQIISAKML